MITVKCAKCGQRYPAGADHVCKMVKGPQITATEVRQRIKDSVIEVKANLERDPVLEALMDKTLAILGDSVKTVREGICPTCGQVIKTVMTNAERQRRYRQRKRDV